MGINYNNADVQLVIGIELSIALAASGMKKIEIMKILASKNLGKISHYAYKIHSATQKNNVSLESALSNEYNWIFNQRLKEFFGAFNVAENIDYKPLLSNLADQIMKTRELTVSERLSKITGNMHKMIAVMMAPILIFMVIFIQDALNEFITLQLRPMLDYVIYGFIAIALIMAISGMREL